jgi:hypothetical protein
MAFYGFKQSDGEYLYYCSDHLPTDYKKPEPSLEAGVQGTLDIGAEGRGQEAYALFLRSGTWGWKTKFVGYIRYMVPRGSVGSADIWRLQAERWIGPPHPDKIVGSAVLQAEAQELIEKTGRHVAPRDSKSHDSQKFEWRRK